MNRIVRVKGREILDSRGNPTVEAEVILESGHIGRVMVPSGASTGTFEALELRDGDPRRYGGKGVRKAVAHINGEIDVTLTGMDAEGQEGLDRTLLALDGTINKSRLGANAILGVSMAACRAVAATKGKPFYRHLADLYANPSIPLSIPLPMVNMISGGLHAGKNIDMQDFLIMPIGAPDYPQALEWICAVYAALKQLLIRRGYIASLVGDEGGFGPSLASNEEALQLIVEAVKESGLQPGTDIAIALDVAATHFYDSDSGSYWLRSEQVRLTPSQLIDKLEGWVEQYPIVSIEDGLAEEDWEGWQELTRRLGARIQLVGDDLFTTNPVRIKRGIEGKAANALLVKMNQIGTLTETVQALRMAQEAGFRTVVSARSGETEDSMLADLAVGLQGGQIKIGSVTRSSRLSKYNQLLRINEELEGRFAGNVFLS